MKFCTKCGNQLFNEAVICPKCGCAVNGNSVKSRNNDTGLGNEILKKIIKVLMIFSTIVRGCLIIPLLWCVPLTCSYFDKVKYGEEITIGFKIVCLIFVDMIAGILMIVDEE